MNNDVCVDKLLVRAQDKYGKANQVCVTAEELAELAAAILKYPRYPDHETAVEKMRWNVLGEIADVYICLGHLRIIFGLTDELIDDAMETKLDRLERWLDSDKGFEQTTIDRELKTGGPTGV